MRFASPLHCSRLRIGWQGRLLRGRRWIALCLALAVAALSPAAPAAAQLSPERHWTVFRQSDGLIANDIYTILATRDAIWFGTSYGISRFDGRWQSVPLGADLLAPVATMPISAPGNVVAMAEDASEIGVWVGTDRGIVAHWDGEQWRSVTLLAAPIHDMHQALGRIWLATDEGLFILEEGSVRGVSAIGAVPVYDLDAGADAIWTGAENGLWQVSNSGSKAVHIQLDVDTPLDAEAVHAVWSGEGESTWLGMGEQLVQYFPVTGDAQVYQPFERDGTQVESLTGIPGDSVWITTNGQGVVQYMYAGGVLAGARTLGGSTEGGLETDQVRMIAVDRDHSLWFATPVGVYRYQPWAWQDVGGALDGLTVNDLLLDRQGALWLATTGEGVQRRTDLYQQPTIYYPSESGLPSEYVNDLEEDDRGAIWAATNAGLARFHAGTWAVPAWVQELPSPLVLHLQADAEHLWIGMATGLARYRFDDHALIQEPRFDARQIIAMQLDELGRLWVATASAELWRFTDGQGWVSLEPVGTGMPSGAPVTALLPDPTVPGAMFAAFQGAGIYRWNNLRWQNVDRRQWTHGDHVLALGYEPADGSLWIGSEIGLSRLDEFSLTTFDSHDGLQSGAIRAILRDGQGNYWFGGQKALSYYQPEQTAPWARLDAISGPGAQARSAGWFVNSGGPIEVAVTMGDIQAATDQMHLFYRISDGSSLFPWREVAPKNFALPELPAGVFQLDIMVRDQAFNYSALASHQITIIDPPLMVSLPLLGEVEMRIFQLLMLFGGLACIGFGYVSYEIVKHRQHVSEAIHRGYNPYISGEPVRKEEMFFGRHDLLERLVANLHNNSIMIHGERRIGKTTLLYQLAHALRNVQDADYWFVPVFIDLEGTTEQRLFQVLMEEIAHIAHDLPYLVSADVQVVNDLLLHSTDVAGYTDREFSRDLRVVVRLLEEYSARWQNDKQVRLILLIDEVDTLSGFDHLYQQQLRRIFMREFAATVGAVVAGIAISKEWDRIESPWYNLFNEVAMTPFTQDDAIRLIVDPVRGYYFYDPDALEFILENSSGRPYRIQQYALEAVNHMLQARRRRIKMQDVLYAHEQIVVVSGQPTIFDPPLRQPPATHSPLQAAS